MQHNCLQQATSFLLDVLKGNKEEEGPMDAAALFEPDGAAGGRRDHGERHVHDHDWPRARCSARRRGSRSARWSTTNVDDIKRAMSRTEMLNPEQLVKFFGTLAVDTALECLHHLRTNMRQNLRPSCRWRASTPSSSRRRSSSSSSRTTTRGRAFYYLGAVLLKMEDKQHFKYIEAAAKVGTRAEEGRRARTTSSTSRR